KVADCDIKSVQLSCSDPDFRVEDNGAVVTLSSVFVSLTGRTFFVLAQDRDGSESVMKIQSTTEQEYKVYYTLTGPGYDRPPVGVFSFDEKGMLKVTRALDRETNPLFELEANVYDVNTRRPTDRTMTIQIRVLDLNDCAPEFSGSMVFSVPDVCFLPAGTVCGKVNATDRDQPGTDHVAIRYSLLSGTNLFSINAETGVISTVSSALDRETQDKHLVTVVIRDMKGAANGMATTGTATITLSDINDNPPTFKQTSFTATVQENTAEKLILRIPVEDKDLVNTDNWFSKFVITKGNENGNFRVDVDPKTNEGLLYVVKPLDFEKTPQVKIEVMAQNKAELKGTTAQWKSAVVDITVTNVDEGPEFIPPIKYLSVKENTANGTVIGTYTALDPETKSSAGIMYYKITDPGSWINVDRASGELKVANTIDRESSYVQNGLYNVTVRAVDGSKSSKSGTGTVVIQVEDENDNIPKLPTGELVLCEKEGTLGSVLLVAQDEDRSPFAEPFAFSLPNNDNGQWSVTKLNDTAAVLQQVKALHLGVHEVDVLVTDLQGTGKEQKVNVRICKCVNGVCPAIKSSITLGPFGWLALLLPLLLLLLLFLLLIFLCVTSRQKVQMDDLKDSGGVLLKSNTEAPGEEVVRLYPLSLACLSNGKRCSYLVIRMFSANMFRSQFGMQYGDGQLLGNGYDGRFHTQDASLLHTWQTNGRYLDQKLYYMGAEDEGRYADDIIRSYGFEGVGSAAGSVGCCSNFGEENLEFLDTLGPKFKTLADVCSKR
uniref:Cadherin domain-containing protein n=1 Tax=Periophthalmus magnuspinnatus TaxID=409849 RepID=A0A3B4BB59_9GOBI